MSHTIYTTDAIVLSSVSTGEADTTLWLLTSELGLIVVRAQSARKSTAKMRGHLQTFSLLRVSLVRGKYVWRVTGAEPVGDQETLISTHPLRDEGLSALARIAAFVRRMILSDTQGALELFEITKKARESLLREGSVVDVIERETIAKILISLGYIDGKILGKIESKGISQNELAQVVNNAIAESHL